MTPSLPFHSTPPLRPWPDLAALSSVRVRKIESSYQLYALAYAKALAIDHPASYYVSLAEAEKVPMRVERWQRTMELERAYALQFDRFSKPKAKRKESPKNDALSIQPKLFADAWPASFNYISSRFPHRPRVSYDLKSSTVRPIDHGAAWRYIQYNTPAADHLLIIDYDCPHGVPIDLVWREAGLLPPTWITVTPGTERGHLAWALATPVCTTNAARIGPLRYLASIEHAYCAAIKGDPGFAGLLTKNPVHPDAWNTQWIDPTPRSLSDLAAVVQLPTRTRSKPATVALVGVGRKVHTFEAIRQWAYNAVPEFWSLGEPAWHLAVRRQVDVVNAMFNKPLLESHLRSISRSIAKWVWKRFTPLTKHQLVLATHTPAVQAMRGKMKGAKKRENLIPAVIKLREEGMSLRDIAAEIHVSNQTVANWLRRGV